MHIAVFVSASPRRTAGRETCGSGSNPPSRIASYAQGFVDYHAKLRSYVSETLTRATEDRLSDPPLLCAATWFSRHPDYDAADNIRSSCDRFRKTISGAIFYLRNTCKPK